jgi:hypothetical protein
MWQAPTVTKKDNFDKMITIRSNKSRNVFLYNYILGYQKKGKSGGYVRMRFPYPERK